MCLARRTHFQQHDAGRARLARALAALQGAGARILGRAQVGDGKGRGGGLARAHEPLGGRGGDGGAGGNPGQGEVYSYAVSVTGSWLGSTKGIGFGNAGDGGMGGAGGNAIARIQGHEVTGSAATDSVTFSLRATSGEGGQGGGGGTGALSSRIKTYTGCCDTRTTDEVDTTGTAPGAAGADGAAGHAIAMVVATTVDLGAGDDLLSFDLLATGVGSNIMAVRDSQLHGGEGWDTLTLGTGAAGEARALVNVRDGLLVLGAGTNTITGWEGFVGTSAADRFTDGVGSQAYTGRGGADLFVFFRGHAGNDAIRDFEAGDVIQLHGFGTRFDSFEEILAATQDVGGSAVIETAAHSTISLFGVTKASLTAEMFGF